MEFWARQSFDLGLAEHDGNCDGCFLKDQADISRALGGRPEAIDYWDEMQRAYPRFGGVGFAGYRVLAAEKDARLAIEKSLRDGRAVPAEVAHTMDPRRFRLVVLQEKRRIEHGAAAFSCACEASMDPEEES